MNFKIIYFSNRKIEKLYSNKKFLFLFFYYIYYFLKYIFLLFKELDSKLFIVARNSILPGFPIIETILFILNKKIIYDLDDAIYFSPENDSFFRSFLRFKWRVKYIASISEAVFVGNKYLESYVKKYNKKVYVYPTTVIINEKPREKNKKNKSVVVGWTGSITTSKYIEDIIPILEEIREQINFELLIIGTQINLGKLEGQCIKWSVENEQKYIKKIDIGLMPLSNNNWTKGKCGLKAIQYSNYSIPAIVSDVGINREIIKNNVTGFVIKDNEEMKKKLIYLISNKEIREKMGIEGYNYIKKNYSGKKIALQINNKLLEILN